MKVLLMVVSWVISPGVLSFQNLAKPHSCGKLDPQISRRRHPRVMGGTPADITHHPWAVSLKKFGRPHCGGTLINSLYVITAAHCVYTSDRRAYERVDDVLVLRSEASNYKVTIGVQNTEIPEETQQTYEVQFVLIHHLYDPSKSFSSQFDYDIALIRLKEPSIEEWGSHSQPICLPDPDPESLRVDRHPDTMGILVGWGHDGFSMTGEDRSTKDLRRAYIPILANTECKTKFHDSVIKVKNHHLCAGHRNGKIDGCQNDSGAGLVIKSGDHMELVGIMNSGMKCGMKGKPGIYARVSQYVDWIKEQIERHA